MSKLTLVSYCHEAHKGWLKHWAQQVNAQTFRDFEILFIPHNWGEETPTQSSINAMFIWDIIDQELDKDLLLKTKIVNHWSPPVIGDVIDFAASCVKTEYMAHWDVDDILHSQRLQLQHEHLITHPETDFLGTRMVGFYGEPAPEMLGLDYVEPNEPNLDAIEHEQIKHCILVKNQNCLGHTTMIYRPEVLETIGGFSRSDVKLDGLSPDFETWKKALMAGYKFHRLPQLCALWRLDSSSIRL